MSLFLGNTHSSIEKRKGESCLQLILKWFRAIIIPTQRQREKGREGGEETEKVITFGDSK